MSASAAVPSMSHEPAEGPAPAGNLPVLPRLAGRAARDALWIGAAMLLTFALASALELAEVQPRAAPARVVAGR